MADANVQVTIGADASGVTSGAADAQAAIRTLVSSVGDAAKSFETLKTAINAAFKAPAANGVQETLERTNAETAKVAKAFETKWDQSVTRAATSFGDAMLKMAQGTQTFQKTINRLASQIETSLVNMSMRALSHWMMHEAQKTAMTKAGAAARSTAESTAQARTASLTATTNLKQITSDAAAAAAAAYKAMSGIPVVGPVLGAAAAAATFAAVEAYGAMASASGGFDIPSGINPITQLHQEEMVLPATLANPMRALLSDYAAADSASTATDDASSGGDTHVHIHAVDAKSVQQLFSDHSDHLMTTINNKLRGGSRLATP